MEFSKNMLIMVWLIGFMISTMGQQQLQDVTTRRYNILAFLPTEVRSHFMGFKPLLRALVAKGHNLTLVSPYPIGDTQPSHTHIVVEPRPPFDFNMFDITKYGLPEPLGSWGFGPFNTDTTLDKPTVRNFLRNDRTAFDVVLFENFLHECFVALGHKYGAPVVQILPSSSSVRVSQWHGQPYDPSYIPEFTASYPSAGMTFRQRVANTVSAFSNTWLARLYYLPRQQALMDKHFVYSGHERRPPLRDLLRNVSLTLVNSHPVIGFPVPTVPSFVYVAGMHCVPAKPLPEELKTIVESNADGVVYFSLGSVIKSSQMAPETITMLLDELAKIKQTVLWKWENDQLPKLPKNVIVRKWFPQNDILGHPNCKLFITHGGIHSTIEATYFGVPMLGISVFGDQVQNILQAKHRGHALLVPYYELTNDSFGNALRNLIDDPLYLANAKKISKIFRDYSTSPIDKAVYWIEYVVRHGGAPHLRTAINDLYWFQYYLLDVIAVLSLGLFLFAFIVFKCCAYACCKSRPKKSTKKKNQ